MIKQLFYFSLLLFVSSAFSQTELPRGLTPEEKITLPNYVSPSRTERAYGNTTPPTDNVRTMAEWEEIEYLVISWSGYSSILAQIVDAAKDECKVAVFCNTNNDVTSAQNYLSNQGIDLTNVEFYAPGNNSIWIRDYGAFYVYKNDVDSLYLVEWLYNRPRPKDDVMPQFYAQQYNIPLYSTTAAPTDLVNTGGNFMVDGLNRAMASKLILSENEPGNPYNVTVKSESDIDQIMHDFMGVSEFVKMTVLPYDGIHHIDMHMKLLDEETLLVGEYPLGVSDGPQIEDNLAYVLTNFTTPFGNPYKVVRIPMPPATNGTHPSQGASYRTYANGVFVNKTYIVPTYRQEYDTIALRILHENLPGYNIVPIDCDNSGSNLISLGGAIHCITNSIGVQDPLWIVHQLIDSAEVNTAFLDARIQHKSGISQATIYYTTNTSLPFITQTMSLIDPAQHIWEAQLLNLNPGDTVYYYIHAEANNGKQQSRPITAPDGYYYFVVTGDGSTSAALTEKEETILSSLYPNPAHDITSLKINHLKGEQVKIDIYAITGELVKPLYDGKIYEDERQFFIDVSSLSSGVYFVTVTSSNGKQWSQKLNKQ